MVKCAFISLDALSVADRIKPCEKSESKERSSFTKGLSFTSTLTKNIFNLVDGLQEKGLGFAYIKQFGKQRKVQFQRVAKFIIKMKTDSITMWGIWNVLRRRSTDKNTLDGVLSHHLHKWLILLGFRRRPLLGIVARRVESGIVNTLVVWGLERLNGFQKSVLSATPSFCPHHANDSVPCDVLKERVTIGNSEPFQPFAKDVVNSSKHQSVDNLDFVPENVLVVTCGHSVQPVFNLSDDAASGAFNRLTKRRRKIGTLW